MLQKIKGSWPRVMFLALNFFKELCYSFEQKKAVTDVFFEQFLMLSVGVEIKTLNKRIFQAPIQVVRSSKLLDLQRRSINFIELAEKPDLNKFRAK